MARTTPFVPVITHDTDQHRVRPPMVKCVTVAYEPRIRASIGGVHFVFPPRAPTGR
jgi:hypothetical protein